MKPHPGYGSVASTGAGPAARLSTRASSEPGPRNGTNLGHGERVICPRWGPSNARGVNSVKSHRFLAVLPLLLALCGRASATPIPSPLITVDELGNGSITVNGAIIP